MNARRKLFPLTRRSTFLVLFGVAYCVIGWSYIIGPPSPRLDQQLRLALTIIPLAGFGALWMFCGLIAIVTAVLRWHKEWGFGALTFIGVLWGATYLLEWIAGDSSTGWRVAVIFWVVSAAVHITAGMTDVQR